MIPSLSDIKTKNQGISGSVTISEYASFSIYYIDIHVMHFPIYFVLIPSHADVLPALLIIGHIA